MDVMNVIDTYYPTTPDIEDTCVPVVNSTNPNSIIGNGSKTFALASEFMPEDTKRKMHVLYRFCREADDIGDVQEGTSEEKRTQLDELMNSNSISEFFRENDIPLVYFACLIEGVKSDIEFKQPETLDDLYNLLLSSCRNGRHNECLYIWY
jgi:phytoene/squalene synthetase